MKEVLAILFLFLLQPVFAQQEQVAVLAKHLTEQDSTELQKVTSIFKWITSNIAYHVRPDRRKVIGKNSLKNYQSEIGEEDDGSPLKPLNERVSETVLRKKVAVCDGYARLFTTLCDLAGIRSEIIVGYASSGTNKPTERFGVNHYWNAVMIDGKWHLLDATWASGYVKDNEFVPVYDDSYFLVPPDGFIKDHYPDDARWTLLPDSKVPEEFRRSPFKQKSFAKYRITSFYPSRGVIETFVGDTLYLELKTAVTEQNRDVCPDLLIDSAIFSHSSGWVFLKPSPGMIKDQHQYIYPVASPDVQWLYLLYNDDLVLRYKVNVKKKKT
jgi:hypothetical protein